MQSTVRKLSAGTVYRLVGLGSICSIVPFSVLMGLMAMGGASTVTFNGQAYMGIQGLAMSPLLGLFIALIFSVLLGTLLSVGLWLYSFFRPITLVYRPVE